MTDDSKCGAVGGRPPGGPCVRDAGHDPGINHMDAGGYPWPVEPTDVMGWARELCIRERTGDASIRALHSPEPCDDCEEYAQFLVAFRDAPTPLTQSSVEDAKTLSDQLRFYAASPDRAGVLRREGEKHIATAIDAAAQAAHALGRQGRGLDGELLPPVPFITQSVETTERDGEPTTRTTTDGQPPAPGFEDKPAPQPVDPATGQHGAYWVLSPEDRAKGFTRPLRDSYTHVGVRPNHGTRPLTEDEEEEHAGCGYVAYEKYPPGVDSLVGRFWTEDRLTSGCGTSTKMGTALSETYARQPKFYAATFCVGCKAHRAVDEFTWDADDERVGS